MFRQGCLLLICWLLIIGPFTQSVSLLQGQFHSPASIIVFLLFYLRIEGSNPTFSSDLVLFSINSPWATQGHLVGPDVAVKGPGLALRGLKSFRKTHRPGLTENPSIYNPNPLRIRVRTTSPRNTHAAEANGRTEFSVLISFRSKQLLNKSCVNVSLCCNPAAFE